jgi:hypothetical protein
VKCHADAGRVTAHDQKILYTQNFSPLQNMIRKFSSKRILFAKNFFASTKSKKIIDLLFLP